MNNEEAKCNMLNDEALTNVIGGSNASGTPAIPVIIKYACMKGCGAEFDTKEERDEHEKNCQYGPLMKPIIF